MSWGKHFGVNKDEFESTVANYLGSLQAKLGFLPLFKEVVHDVWTRKLRDAETDTEHIRNHIRALKERQMTILDRIPACRSELVQQKLETQIEELDQTVRSAEETLNDRGVKEAQIEAYFATAKKS